MSEFERKPLNQLTPIPTPITDEDLFLVAKKVGEAYLPYSATAEDFESAVGIPQAIEALESFTDHPTLTTGTGDTRVTGDGKTRVLGQTLGGDRLGLTGALLRLEREMVADRLELGKLKRSFTGFTATPEFQHLVNNSFPQPVRDQLDSLQTSITNQGVLIAGINTTVGNLTSQIPNIYTDITSTIGNDLLDLDNRIGEAEGTLGIHAGLLPTLATKSELNAVDSYAQVTRSTVNNHAGMIALKADQTTVNALEGELDLLEGELTVAYNEINAKASQLSVDALEGRVTDSEAQLLITAGEVATKVSTTEFNSLESRVSTAESSIIQHAGQILAKAESTELDAVDNRLVAAEGTLSLMPGQIALKANQIDVDLLTGQVSNHNTSIMQNSSQISLMAERNEGGVTVSGETTSASAARIVDNTADFVDGGILKGDLVVVTEDGVFKGQTRLITDVLTTELVLDEPFATNLPVGTAYTAGTVGDVASAALSIAADEIELRVTSTSLKDEVVSAINLSPSAVRISGSKIQLNGDVSITGNVAITDSGNASYRLEARDSAGGLRAAFGNVTGLPDVPAGTRFGVWGEMGSGIWISKQPRPVFYEPSFILRTDLPENTTSETQTWKKEFYNAIWVNSSTPSQRPKIYVPAVHRLFPEPIVVPAGHSLRPNFSVITKNLRRYATANGPGGPGSIVYESHGVGQIANDVVLVYVRNQATGEWQDASGTNARNPWFGTANVALGPNTYDAYGIVWYGHVKDNLPANFGELDPLYLKRPMILDLTASIVFWVVDEDQVADYIPTEVPGLQE